MISRSHLLIVAALLAAMGLASALAFGFIPQRVPMHWGLDGEVNRYGSRWEAALALPLAAAAVTTLLLTLARLGPFRSNIERFSLTYGRIMIAVVAFLLGFHFVLLVAALGRPVPIPAVVLIGVGILFAVLGNWMGKVRRNFWIGFRTPWTLANDTVWEKTHRVGGRLMVGYGVLIVLLSLVTPPVVALGWLMGGAVGLLIWSIAYSILIYRRMGQVDEL